MVKLFLMIITVARRRCQRCRVVAIRRRIESLRLQSSHQIAVQRHVAFPYELKIFTFSKGQQFIHALSNASLTEETSDSEHVIDQLQHHSQRADHHADSKTK